MLDTNELAAGMAEFWHGEFNRHVESLKTAPLESQRSLIRTWAIDAHACWMAWEWESEVPSRG